MRKTNSTEKYNFDVNDVIEVFKVSFKKVLGRKEL